MHTWASTSIDFHRRCLRVYNACVAGWICGAEVSKTQSNQIIAPSSSSLGYLQDSFIHGRPPRPPLFPAPVACSPFAPHIHTSLNHGRHCCEESDAVYPPRHPSQAKPRIMTPLQQQLGVLLLLVLAAASSHAFLVPPGGGGGSQCHKQHSQSRQQPLGSGAGIAALPPARLQVRER